ncbi:helix-turn-helix transcriptional regulator [Spirosoma aerolatum]|uniref:helix-turn-helix transcriptional regulator n=1 Tax=Spirosoma aerolatum TaxID=1211326 RepID=UPI0009AD17E7|nr:AraC family transcriptional regulator [Spirosoma aerolatum]
MRIIHDTTPLSNSAHGENTPGLYARFSWQHWSFEQGLSAHYFTFQTQSAHHLTTLYGEECFKIVLCISGQANIDSLQRRFSFQAGKLYLYKALGVSESNLQAGMAYELLHIHFPVSKLQAVIADTPLQDMLLNGNQVLSLALTPTIFSLILTLVNSEFQGALRQLQVESALYQLLFEIIKTADRTYPPVHHAISTNQTRLIKEAKELLDTHTGYISIRQLAKEVGTNMVSLKTGFKALYKTTIFSYQQNKNLQKAYELLLVENMTIQQVSECCGYQSLGSFSNAFLRRYGHRPSALLKRPIE